MYMRVWHLAHHEQQYQYHLRRRLDKWFVHDGQGKWRPYTEGLSDQYLLENAEQLCRLFCGRDDRVMGVPSRYASFR
jgi:hypothetical protein